MEMISKNTFIFIRNRISMHCYEDQIDIVNYKEISRISDTGIDILSNQNRIVITGKNLTITRL